METGHNKPISAVAFNPKYATMATACSSIVRDLITSHRHYGIFLSQIKMSFDSGKRGFLDAKGN